MSGTVSGGKVSNPLPGVAQLPSALTKRRFRTQIALYCLGITFLGVVVVWRFIGTGEIETTLEQFKYRNTYSFVTSIIYMVGLVCAYVSLSLIARRRTSLQVPQTVRRLVVKLWLVLAVVVIGALAGIFVNTAVADSGLSSWAKDDLGITNFSSSGLVEVGDKAVFDSEDGEVTIEVVKDDTEEGWNVLEVVKIEKEQR